MEQTKPINLKLASVWKRAIAFAIDMLIIAAIISLLIPVLNWVLRIPVGYSAVWERSLSLQIDEYTRENFGWLVLIYTLAKLLVVLLYFAGLESSRWQSTFGKKIFGFQVGNCAGKRISTGKAVFRTFGKVLSSQILLIGYLMAFFTKNKQALHDFLAGTFVFEN
ncbi:MAG TPA: RDD family protein [Pyrinomonadaceae bacterium]|jgi:uncharacterized RDD family membrane protein YckC